MSDSISPDTKSNIKKPNLFVVGAMKSGSSSLTHYLHMHPQIFMSMRPKEPSYFVDQKTLKAVYPAMEKLGLWQSEARYLELYNGAGKVKYLGDASQNYARIPLVKGVPQRIADYCSNAKIIYIVRDPIERTISHYWYMVQNFGERRPIVAAVKSSDDYVMTSYYAMQLRPYLELFGTSNIKVVVSEELRCTPNEVMQSIFSWLGVDQNFQLSADNIRSNATPTIIRQTQGLGLLYKLRYSTAWGLIGKLVPKRIRSIGVNISEHSVDRGAVSTKEVRSYLFDIQKEQVKELSELLGRSFDIWPNFSNATKKAL